MFNDYCDKMEENISIRKRREVHYEDTKGLGDRVSKTLNELFGAGYNMQFRPGIGVHPTEVEVNLAIRSMGPVDETKEKFTLDCYFRQYWTDPRLSFNESVLDELAMNWQFLDKIWRPDTFFLNGKDSYLHKIAVPNRFIRIAPSGRISFSQRLTVSARCKMDLHKFPLDSQICPLEIGSFGHTSQDLVYKWAKAPLSMEELSLAQYIMVNWTHGHTTEQLKNGNRSVIFLHFTFDRTLGFYFLQIYIPLTIIVMSSWVSFWLVKTEKGQETPARTGLGATSALAVVTIGFGGKTKPQVAYATALDVFIIICSILVFFALVEFALVNFLDIYIKRYKEKEVLKVERARIIELAMRSQKDVMVHSSDSHRAANYNGGSKGSSLNGNKVETFENILDEVESSLKNEVFSGSRPAKCFDAALHKSKLYYSTTEFLHNLDRYSRKLFPITFLLLNIVYWTSYIYIL